MKPKWILFLMFNFCLISQGDCSEDENAFRFGGYYGNILQKQTPDVHNFGGFIEYRRGITDDWVLFSSALYGYSPKTNTDMLSLFVGASYIIDIGSWVPTLDTGIGYVGALFAGNRTPDVGLLLGTGLEYHRWRHLGIGGKVDYTILFLNREERLGIFTLTAYMARYF